MLNWGAFAGKCAKTDFQLGADIMNTTANYLTSSMKQLQLKYQGKSIKAQEKAFRDQQADFEKQAGRDQEKGRQQREQIGLSGGQAISQVRTTAAGSGIDMSSNVVKKAIGDLRTQIMNNYAISAENEQQAAQQSLTQAKNANARANEMVMSGIWNQHNLESEKFNQKFGVMSGAMSAAGNWLSGMGEAVGSLFGG